MNILDYDSQGFIMGVRRMSQGIDSVHDDTQELIQIFKSQNQIANTKINDLTRAVQHAGNRAATRGRPHANRRQAPGGSPALPLSDETPQARIARRSANRRNNPHPTNDNRSRDSRRPTISSSSDAAADQSRTRSPNNPNGGSNNPARERDANGRFAGGAKSANQAAFSRLMSSLKGLSGDSNIGGIDPVLDSLKEAKDLLSPLGRAAKLGGRAAKFSVSKLKALKRREPLPIDQDRHNRENEKLLDKIWKAIRKAGGRSGGGLLGGLLGGLGGGRRGRGRGLLGGIKNLGARGLRAVGGIKGLGVVGAVAGAASLGMDWKSLNKEEKTERVGQAAGGGVGAVIGGTIGSVVPVVGTAVGAVVGGYLGAKGGAILATTIEPHIKGWTTSLKSYNLAGKMESFWKAGMTPVFTTFADLGRSTRSWLGDMFRKGKSLFGFTDDDDDDVSDSDSIWTGDTAALKGTAAKAAYTASTYDAGNIGGLDDAMTRRLVASTVLTESAGGNPNAVNSGGYLGRYQAGAGWLAEAGLIRGGANSVKAAKAKDGYGNKTDWAWATSGGMTRFLKDSRNWTEGMSREKYLANPDIQDQAFQKATTKSYNQLKRMGAITASTPQKEVAGLLKAAHLGGAGNANKVAKGGTGATDAYGTSTSKYYNDIVKNRDGLDAALRKKTVIDKVVEVVTPTTDSPKNSAGNYKGGILGDDARNLIKSSDTQPVIPASKDALIFKSSLDVATGGESRSYVAPTLPTRITSKARNIAPTSIVSRSGYGAASFAPTPILKIPSMPKVSQRLDSGSNDKPLIVQTSNDTINQNVSDRDLAHAITGGLGQSRQWT